MAAAWPQAPLWVHLSISGKSRQPPLSAWRFCSTAPRAIYGADAVAGVVNVILKTEAEGLLLNARYGTVTDGGLNEYRTSATGGLAWRSGSVNASYEFFESSDLGAFDRDFIQTPTNFDLIADETRHSFSLSGQQHISDVLTLTFDGLASLEESSPDQTDFRSIQKNDIERELFWGGIGVIGEVFGFSYDLQGSYSARNEDRLSRETRTGASGPRITDFRSETSVYTIDARISRLLFSLPGGDAAVGLGGGVRGEEVQLQTLDGAGREFFFSNEDRVVASIFGELILPVFGAENNIPFVEELEINASVRREDFNDVGASTNPKVGFLWSPVKSFSLRGSYGTSFRAPEIRTLNGQPNLSVTDISTFGAGDPFPELGDNIALFRSGANPDLVPQESRSYSIGGDFNPGFLPGLQASVNYFDIRYEDQITRPDAALGVPGLFIDPRGFGFYSFNPPDEVIADLVANAGLFGSAVPGIDLTDPSTWGPINLVYDNRSQNLAVSSARGLDVNIAYRRETAIGDFNFDLNGVYLFRNAFAVTEDSPLVDNVDTFGNPVDLQFRASVGYLRNGFSANLFVNYTDGYTDNQIPDAPVPVDSWTTVDWSLAYAFQSTAAALSGTTLRLSVQNVFDNDPPFVAGQPLGGDGIELGYDPTNASPRGRFVAFEISKQF